MSKVYYNHTTKLGPVKSGLVPGCSIALKKEGDEFVYGIAICSKYDNFDKKLGRKIAEARMNDNFRRTSIPAALINMAKEVGEDRICVHFLYQLAEALTKNQRKWKGKLTRFNGGVKTRIIPMTSSPKIKTVDYFSDFSTKSPA